MADQAGILRCDSRASDPPRPARLWRAASDDVDQQAEQLRGWNQTYAQVSSGRFSGALTEVELGALRLFSEFTGQGLLQTGLLPKHLIAVGAPLDLPGAASFCGAPVGETTLNVFSGSNGFEYLTPSALLMAGVVAPRDMVRQLLEPQDQDVFDRRFAYAHLAPIEPGVCLDLKKFIAGVLRMVESAPDLLDNGPIMAQLSRGLLSQIAGALTAHDARGDVAAPVQKWAIVARARDFIHSQPDAPITVAELALAAGVSRRSLQNCFQDVLAMSPAQFLRMVRMNGVRRSLREANSVTEAAASWGFWHFGHFSRDYAQIFGELPSQTLKRHRRLS